MSNLDYIFKRKSIRKFKDEKVDHKDLKRILECGLNAPSAKNMQNWHFVVIESKDKIKEIANIVKKKQNKIIKASQNEMLAKSFESKIRYYTFFENAPVLILVYAAPYSSQTTELLSDDDLKKFNAANPGIQNIGAAIQNILLAASTLGYGTCWMTGPNFAIKEIEEYVSLPNKNYSLVAMTPVGVPSDGKHPSPKKQSINEKVTFI